MHIDPSSFEGFMELIEEGYYIAKHKLLSICYISDK